MTEKTEQRVELRARSTPRRAWSSRPAPAAARPGCWSRASCGCCSPAPRPRRSSRSPSRARPRRKWRRGCANGCSSWRPWTTRRRASSCGEREVPESEIEAVLPRARTLFEQLLTAPAADHDRHLPQLVPAAPAARAARRRRAGRRQPRGADLLAGGRGLAALREPRAARPGKPGGARARPALPRLRARTTRARLLTNFLLSPRRMVGLHAPARRTRSDTRSSASGRTCRSRPTTDVRGPLCARCGSSAASWPSTRRCSTRNAAKPTRRMRVAACSLASEAVRRASGSGRMRVVLTKTDGEPRKPSDSAGASALGRPAKRALLDLHATLGRAAAGGASRPRRPGELPLQRGGAPLRRRAARRLPAREGRAPGYRLRRHRMPRLANWFR